MRRGLQSVECVAPLVCGPAESLLVWTADTLTTSQHTLHNHRIPCVPSHTRSLLQGMAGRESGGGPIAVKGPGGGREGGRGQQQAACTFVRAGGLTSIMDARVLYDQLCTRQPRHVLCECAHESHAPDWCMMPLRTDLRPAPPALRTVHCVPASRRPHGGNDRCPSREPFHLKRLLAAKYVLAPEELSSAVLAHLRSHSYERWHSLTNPQHSIPVYPFFADEAHFPQFTHWIR